MKPSNDREAVTLILEGLEAQDVTPEVVHDGEESIPVHSVSEAVDAIMAVDMATVDLVLPNGLETFIWFVLGNDPEEVAADCGVSLLEFIDPITDVWWD